jgi:peptidoglycan-N-acetylglucosamine deacetylase
MNVRITAMYHTALSATVSLLPTLLPYARCRLHDDDCVALTIDDGPSPEGTLAALDALDVHTIPATFFITGSRAKSCPGPLRAIAERGHELASHGFFHRNVMFVRADELRDDIRRSLDAIEEITGVRPVRYRPPYGRLNPLHADIPRSLGCEIVLWNRMPRDYNVSQRGATLLSNLRCTRGGDIVVLHDNSVTLRRLPGLIHAFARHLREHGLTAVPLPSLKGNP